MKASLIALASAIHLLPHPFGVSTVGATALYAGAYADRHTHWLVPCIPLLLGLLVTGLFEPLVMVFVFAGFALASFAGRWFLRGERSSTRFAAAIVTGASIFFLLSNFSIWLAGFYPPTVEGLVACYLAGLPFLGAAALADAAYCFVLFGLHRLIDQYVAEPVTT